MCVMDSWILASAGDPGLQPLPSLTSTWSASDEPCSEAGSWSQPGRPHLALVLRDVPVQGPGSMGLPQSSGQLIGGALGLGKHDGAAQGPVAAHEGGHHLSTLGPVAGQVHVLHAGGRLPGSVSGQYGFWGGCLPQLQARACARCAQQEKGCGKLTAGALHALRQAEAVQWSGSRRASASCLQLQSTNTIHSSCRHKTELPRQGHNPRS